MLGRWPHKTPLLAGSELTSFWQLWFTALVVAVNTAPSVIAPIVSVAGLTAAITTQTIAVPTGGLYRLTYYLRKTVVGASSTLTVTLGWTDQAQAMTQAFPALTTNAVTAYQSNTVLVRADAGSNLSYAVAYGSTGTPQQFAFDLCVEQMPS